jgi:hypothetical protein
MEIKQSQTKSVPFSKYRDDYSLMGLTTSGVLTPVVWDGNLASLSSHLMAMSTRMEDFADQYSKLWKSPNYNTISGWGKNLERLSASTKGMVDAAGAAAGGTAAGGKGGGASAGGSAAGAGKSGVMSWILKGLGAVGGFAWGIMKSVPPGEQAIYGKALLNGMKTSLWGFIQTNPNGEIVDGHSTLWAKAGGDLLHIGTNSLTLGTAGKNKIGSVLKSYMEKAKAAGAGLAIEPDPATGGTAFTWGLTGAAPPESGSETPAEAPAPAPAEARGESIEKLRKIANGLESLHMYEDADEIDWMIKMAAQTFLTKSKAKDWRNAMIQWKHYFSGMVSKINTKAEENPDKPALKNIANYYKGLSQNFESGTQKAQKDISYFFGKPKGIVNWWNRRVLDKQYTRTK